MLTRLTKPMTELADALAVYNSALLKAKTALDALGFHLAPRVRRASREWELGYPVPDFVFRAWEYQRRTFGSGNGREDKPR